MALNEVGRLGGRIEVLISGLIPRHEQQTSMDKNIQARRCTCQSIPRSNRMGQRDCLHSNPRGDLAHKCLTRDHNQFGCAELAKVPPWWSARGRRAPQGARRERLGVATKALLSRARARRILVKLWSRQQGQVLLYSNQCR